MIYLSSVERMDNVAATSTDEGPPGKPAWEMSTAPKTALQKVFVARSVSWSIVHPCSHNWLFSNEGVVR